MSLGGACHNNLTAFGAVESAAAAAAASHQHHQHQVAFGLLATGSAPSAGILSNYGSINTAAAANNNNSHTSEQYHAPAHLHGGLAAVDSSSWNVVPNLHAKSAAEVNPWGHAFNGFENYNPVMTAGEMFMGHQGYNSPAAANLDVGKNSTTGSAASAFSYASPAGVTSTAAAAAAYRNYNLAKAREHHAGSAAATFGFY